MRVNRNSEINKFLVLTVMIKNLQFTEFQKHAKHMYF